MHYSFCHLRPVNIYRDQVRRRARTLIAIALPVQIEEDMARPYVVDILSRPTEVRVILAGQHDMLAIRSLCRDPAHYCTPSSQNRMKAFLSATERTNVGQMMMNELPSTSTSTG
jgi:hypothetical protein